MKIKFLQFIKKQNIAIKLAGYNLLILLKGITAFNHTLFIASWFIKDSELNIYQRIRHFLKAENNPLLNAFAKEISCLQNHLLYMPLDKNIFLDGDIIFKTSSSVKDSIFLSSLFKKIISQNFPILDADSINFDNILDISEDMRFYGAELESLYDYIGGYETCCKMEIDWISTSRENLWLNFEEKCLFTQKLSPQGQHNLYKLFTYMLFEKSIFISYWNGIMLSPQDEVGFLDFDTIYKADNSLKKYALSYVDSKKEPSTALQYKLRRALQILERYCPDVEIFKDWGNHLIIAENKTNQNNRTTLLKQLKENGFNFGEPLKPIMTKPQDVAYLLDTARHKKDPQFRKSSIYYWLPLMIAIYLLLKYF